MVDFATTMDGLGAMFYSAPDPAVAQREKLKRALSAEVTHFGDDPLSPGASSSFLWGGVPAVDPEADSIAALDALETGEAARAAKTEQTQPARMKRQWQQAHVVKGGRSDEFRMYMDQTGDFVFCARRVGKNFYISQYEHDADDAASRFDDGDGDESSWFSSGPDERPVPPHVFALLFEHDDAEMKGAFRLLSKECEYCDGHLRRFTCGGYQNVDRELASEQFLRERGNGSNGGNSSSSSSRLRRRAVSARSSRCADAACVAASAASSSSPSSSPDTFSDGLPSLLSHGCDDRGGRCRHCYRQCLGKFTHEMRDVSGAMGIRARHVSAELPAFRAFDEEMIHPGSPHHISDGKVAFRDPWCPRVKHLRRSCDEISKRHLGELIDEAEAEAESAAERMEVLSSPPASPARTVSSSKHLAVRRPSKVGLSLKKRDSTTTTTTAASASEGGSSGDATSSGEDIRDSDDTGSDSGRSSGGSSPRRSLSDVNTAEFQAARFVHLNRRRKSLSLNLRKELMDPVPPVRLGTKMPRWDDDAESLVLGFERNRVHASSSKNLIITVQSSVLGLDFLDKRGRRRKAGKSKRNKKGSEHAVLQFGKTTSGRFNIDFRYPMSPIQAFALAVSSFGWSTKNRLK
jgi:hypothetical protein